MSGKAVHLVSSNRWRGSAQYALDICSDLKAKGWETCVVTRDARAVDLPFVLAGIELRHLPLGGIFDPGSPVGLSRQMRRDPKGTVYHTHRYKDALTALLARRLASRRDIKVVLTRHTARPGRDNFLYRRIYRNLDAHIFISNTVRDRFLSTWQGRRLPFDESRIRVVYESSPYPRREIMPEPQKGQVIVLYVGAVKPGKGLETLIDAMMMLRGKRTRVRIAGSGDPDYWDRLRRRVVARGVQDLMDWRRNPDNVTELVEQSHIGVLPSVEPEAFGLNNIRFMAAGRPLVCTDSGAQSEYLTDGVDALLVSAGDASALGRAILRLAGDGSLRREMGARGAATYASKLSWEQFMGKLLEIYTS